MMMCGHVKVLVIHFIEVLKVLKWKAGEEGVSVTVVHLIFVIEQTKRTMLTRFRSPYRKYRG